MMKNDRSKFRSGLRGLMAAGAVAVVLGGASGALAQDNNTKPSKKQTNTGGRDPFKKYEPKVAVRKYNGQVVPPPIADRIQRYKAQKAAAMSARMQAPKPTTALLLSEVQVIGISRTPRGYAAIVEATPIKLSYVIYPGEPFYDGQLVAIEDNRLVFRHETVFADGRREKAVEIKPLRQPTSVNAMTTSKSSTSADEASRNEPVATAKP